MATFEKLNTAVATAQQEYETVRLRLQDVANEQQTLETNVARLQAQREALVEGAARGQEVTKALAELRLEIANDRLRIEDLQAMRPKIESLPAEAQQKLDAANRAVNVDQAAQVAAKVDALKPDLLAAADEFLRQWHLVHDEVDQYAKLHGGNLDAAGRMWMQNTRLWLLNTVTHKRRGSEPARFVTTDYVGPGQPLGTPIDGRNTNQRQIQNRIREHYLIEVRRPTEASKPAPVENELAEAVA